MQCADPDVMPVVCPYFDCPSNEQATASHVVSFGAFVREDGQAVQRRRCGCCRRTFSGHTGTMFARMRAPHSLEAHALELYAEGVSKSAIGRSLGFAASTIARCVKLAGQQAGTFHEVRVHPQDVGEVQIDELRCRGSGDAAAAWSYGAIEIARDPGLAPALVVVAREAAAGGIPRMNGPSGDHQQRTITPPAFSGRGARAS